MLDIHSDASVTIGMIYCTVHVNKSKSCSMQKGGNKNAEHDPDSHHYRYYCFPSPANSAGVGNYLRALII